MKSDIILVEFVVVDRFHCGILIPYLNGILKRRALNPIYLRIGFFSKGALDEDNRVRVDPEGKKGILRVLRENRYRDILFSHLPSKVLIDEIKRFARKIYFIETFNDTESNFGDFCDRYSIDERNILDEIPDFSFININSTAEGFRPLPHLFLFNECNYRKSITNNPIYKELKIPEYVKRNGCTFCMSPDLFHNERFDADKIRSHILSAIKSTNWGGFRKRVRVIGEILVHNIDRFFDVVLEEGIDDTDFLFNFRVDNFLRESRRIERALQIISKSRNRFYLALVGVENFSNVELDRYNKGFKNYDIFQFLSSVFELKYRYPEHFNYDEYGGFSLILFNPYTRIEDLRLNYHLVKYLGIEKLCGKLFTSRIRLYKELPIYHLAKRDNLIIKRYKDESLDTARVNFYREEIPWRYKEKKMEMINKSITENSDLNGVIKLLAGESEPIQLENSYKKYLMPEASLDIYYRTEAEFMRIYRARKMGKVEFTNHSEFKRHLKYIKKNFKYYRITENRSNVVGLKNNIFYSNTLDLNKYDSEFFVERGGDKNYFYNIGRLLGYPECCSRNYSNNMFFLINNYLFVLIYMRYRYSDDISIFLNPFIGDLIFIPCDLKCEKAIDFVKMRNIATKNITGYDSLTYSEMPVIYLLPFDVSSAKFKDNMGYIIVEPLSQVDEEFSFRPLRFSGRDRRLDYILSSDRLIMRDGFMELYKGKRHIHTFCAEANVWYYKKVLDYRFWKEFSEAYYRSLIYRSNFERRDYSPDSISEFSEILSFINKNLDLLINMGYELIDKKAERNVLVLSLRKGDKRFELRIQKKGESSKYYMQGNKYIISIGKSEDAMEVIDNAARLVLRIIEDGK